MPVTRLEDIYDAEVFQDISAENIPELTAFAGSGVITQNETLSAHVDAAGKTAELPYWLDIDAEDGSETGGEPEVWSDDPDQESTPAKISQAEMTTRKQFLHKSWSSMDLTNQLTVGENALSRVVSRIDSYWARDFQRRVVQMSLGVLSANLANNGGDMSFDISTQDGNNAGAANLFNRSAFTNAAFTLGDMWQSTSAIAVHSAVQQRMVEDDAIEYIKDSEGNLTIPVYMGRRVIVDDGCPAIAGTTSGVRFVSVLYGEGAFGYANGTPDTPTELARKASAGNGGGQSILHARRKMILHALGHSFTSSTMTANGGSEVSRADLAAAANWQRTYARKNVPMAFLITN